jgi:heme ABC exporter ATP-binding subunit CcmA
MSGGAPAVQVDRVWKYFGDFPAVRDITFAAEPGSCVALLGRNGAGKTTLLRMIAGLSHPSEGDVRLLGRPVRDGEARARIGLLGHGIGVYEELSAFENLRHFATLFGLPDPSGAASRWLERVNLAHVRDSPVREFSRGMRQRLAVARAFLHDPVVLLLDEPFTSLDDRAIALLQSLLAEALARGATVIMSTHQLREAMELATHAVLLVRGKIGYSGPRPVEMLEDTGWLYRQYGEA